jgi:hypothetical protein
VNKLTLRRNAFRIHDKEHVIATRCHRVWVNSVRRHGADCTGSCLCERALDRALLCISVMGTGCRSHQYDLGDLARLLGLNDKRVSLTAVTSANPLWRYNHGENLSS